MTISAARAAAMHYLRTAIQKFLPTIDHTPIIRSTTVVTGGIDLQNNQNKAEKDAIVQAIAQAQEYTPEKKPPALTRDRVAAVPITRNLTKIQNLATGRSSLHGRVSIDRNTIIGGAIVASIAVATAFAALSAKVGTLAASQLITSNIVAFLQPGVTIFGFALKTGMFVTMNTVAAVFTGIVMPIALPVVSAVVVTGVSVLLMLLFLNQIIKKVEDSVQKGLTTMKDAVTDLPGMVLRQVPGYGMLTSIFGDSKTTQTRPAVKTPSAQKQEDVRKEIEKANKNSGALDAFDKIRKEAEKDDQKAAAEKAIAVLKGEAAPKWAASEPSKGLADILEPPRSRPGIYTRETLHRARTVKQANA